MTTTKPKQNKPKATTSQEQSDKPYIQVRLQFFTTVFFTAIFTLLISVSLLLGWLALSQGGLSDQAKYELTKREILGLIEENSVWEAPSLEKQRQGELKGLVSSLEDPYSSYLTDEDEAEFQNSLNQRYEGIGVRFDDTEEGFIIDKVFADSPAERSGLLEGDILTKVEGKDITDLPLAEVAEQIRGPKDTEVRLTFLRDDSELSEFTIIRGPIEGDLTYLTIQDEVAIIEITTFGGSTTTELDSIASQILNNSEVEHVILDLRGNSGGLLDQSINVLSYFLDPNTIVVRQKTADQETVLRTTAVTNSLQTYDLSVLIDNRSASASEIVAGALRDQREVTVYGQISFGKGTVQRLYDLNEGKLRLTIAKWLTPNGDVIDQNGIAPDIEVSTDEDSLEVALQNLQ
jgi:carboxyl-terminal processing protease